MNSLRDMMETTFAAAAFGERGLNEEAREIVGRSAQFRSQESATKSSATSQRRRPSLKA
jgi:hypothetical protein